MQLKSDSLGVYRSYSFSVDMWSAGCIFLELECLEPAFGALAEIELLFRVFYVLGTPTEETWPGVTDMPFWLDQFPKFDYQGFMTEFDVASDMLRLRPSQRVTAAVALERLQAQCNELCVTPTTGSKRKAMSPL